MTNHPRHEILVGLHVTDPESYTRYRAGMTPILHAMGGFFRYDYQVTMLQGESEEPHNRVFVLSFPDEATMERFFADERYQAIRTAHFNPAVSSGGVLASFNAPPIA